MEIVVMIIMAMVIFSFILKMAGYGWRGRIASAAAVSLFILLTYEYATVQSKSRIADWLSQPELMLDVAVWLTVDVAFQICFCVLAAKSTEERLSPAERRIFMACNLIPGLLIFPVMFALLTGLIFSLPGMDFSVMAWCMAGGILFAISLLSAGLRWLIPEREIRLEMIFMVSLITGALGVVATVNGRTTAVGTDHVEWGALACVAAILLAGLVTGTFYYRFIIRKTISKIK